MKLWLLWSLWLVGLLVLTALEVIPGSGWTLSNRLRVGTQVLSLVMMTWLMVRECKD